MIANNGIKKPISLVKIDQENDKNFSNTQKVISPPITKKLINMMERVVSSEGTGRKAAITGYRVVGKTGTAKKVSGKGYEEGHYRSTFAGIIPLRLRN